MFENDNNNGFFKAANRNLALRYEQQKKHFLFLTLVKSFLKVFCFIYILAAEKCNHEQIHKLPFYNIFFNISQGLWAYSCYLINMIKFITLSSVHFSLQMVSSAVLIWVKLYYTWCDVITYPFQYMDFKSVSFIFILYILYWLKEWTSDIYTFVLIIIFFCFPFPFLNLLTCLFTQYIIFLSPASTSMLSLFFFIFVFPFH